MSSPENGTSFVQRFGLALLLGVPGIVALVGYIYLTTPLTAVPAGLSLPLLALLSAVNPLLLLVVACLLGAYAAPRVGLQSYVIGRAGTGDGIWRRLRGEVRLAVGIGILGGVLVVALDAVMAPFVAQDLPQSVIGATRPTVLDVIAYAPVRFLYGGITEELMLRFGLMSVLAFVGWRATGRRIDGPRPVVMWVAILVSAILFGLGHLPALAQSVDLTPALIARTVLLNTVAGILFGWLYWRRSLEAAMVAHASFHVPLVALSLVQVAVV
ncbi:CPBP family intramembrane metalloprotease [Halogeometricum sp. S1BR25-6]|uniref:CPBP family intramembrane metalloprotease n=1 Tax=Halogeometricum salsisoli TaxID=2950536 RepID=A0ABU2GJM0_9EURY|nr:CPBP family intramembrane glutamic endopeptidase [Halogeometricum sp. S1BR25-6]MDS0301012.1 CPBP family intramembrane metalloprotease [Halogeometricum sp. S1BR25-6]